MDIPFSQSDFLAVFGRYNEATSLAPVALVALAVAAVLGLLRRARNRDRRASFVLMLLWAWSGVAMPVHRT